MPSRNGGSHSQPCQYSSFKKKFLISLTSLAIFGFFLNLHISFSDPGDGGINASCSPRRHIVFLKTHKCAGSSLQNILMRFGEEHDLNFVLPLEGNYLGHPLPFSRTLLPNYRTRSIPYHILAHHTRFDHREISAIMPRDSLYLTIVREPSQLFESAFSYYGLDRLYQSDIHAFISYLPRLEPSVINKRLKGRYGINQMYFDLGGDGLNNESVARSYIERLDSWFDLVLVAERMDESLVLMRHALCWDMDQVVTFKLNARADKFRSNLTDQERDDILRLNRADVLLYIHFYDKLDRQVEAFGRERMASEVAQLRNRTAEWYSLCVQGEQLHPTDGTTSHRHYHNPRVKVFQTRDSNATCGAMTVEELEFTDRLRKRQVAKYPGVYRVVRKPLNRKVYKFKNGTRDMKTYRDYINYIKSRKVQRPLKNVSNFSKGFAPTKDSGRSVPSKDSGLFVQAKDSGRFVPSKDSERSVPSKDSGRFVPSKDSGRFVPSKDSGLFVQSKDSGRFVPSKDSGRFVPSKVSGSFVPYRNVSKTVESFVPSKSVFKNINSFMRFNNETKSFLQLYNVSSGFENVTTLRNSSKFSKSFTSYNNESNNSESSMQFKNAKKDLKKLNAIQNVIEDPKSIKSSRNVPKASKYLT